MREVDRWMVSDSFSKRASRCSRDQRAITSAAIFAADTGLRRSCETMAST